MNRLNLFIDGNSYGQSVHRQLLMKEQNQDKHNVTSYMKMATDVMFNKMNSKAGIKKFGEQTIAAVFKEFKQINDG